MNSLIQQNKDLDKYLGLTVEIPKDLPEGGEAVYLIPSWKKLGTYTEAVVKVTEALAERYGANFINYRDGKLGPGYLRRIDGPDLPEVLTVQFGSKYSNKSLNTVRYMLKGDPNEVILGAYEMLIIALLSPHLLHGYEWWNMWAAGADEYTPYGYGQFLECLVLGINGIDGFVFSHGSFGGPFERYKIMSGFFPQIKYI